MTRRSRILFTCRPPRAHFDCLLPIADAFRRHGHVVAIASGRSTVTSARALGYTGIEIDHAEALHARRAPSKFVTSIAAIELPARARVLEAVMAQWRPDLVVHEIAELAAPLVATALGVPYVEVGCGPLWPRRLVRAAAAAAAPEWRLRKLEPDPLAGLFKYAYVDQWPRSLQSNEIADVAVVQAMRPAPAAAAGRREVTIGLTPHVVVAAGAPAKVVRSLAAGCPLVLLPRRPDQRAVADAVVASGAGIRLDPTEVDTDAVRDAVARVGTDSAFAIAANRVRAEVDLMPTAGETARMLEHLL